MAVPESIEGKVSKLDFLNVAVEVNKKIEPAQVADLVDEALADSETIGDAVAARVAAEDLLSSADASATYAAKATEKTAAENTLLPVRSRRVQRLIGETHVYRILDLGSGVALAATFPNGAAFKTIDYGRSWTLKQINAGGAATLHDLIRLRNTSIVLGATDNGGKMTRSTDLGETWTNSAASPVVNSVLSNPKVNTMIELDNGVILAGLYHNSSGGGKVHRSTDQGLTWDATGGVSLDTAKGVNIFLDFGAGVVVAGAQNSGGTVSEWFRSTNYGVSWTRISSGLNVSPAEFGHCGVVLGSGVAVIGTYGGSAASHLYRTTDSGLTWTTVDTDTAEGFFDLSRLSGDFLMASTGISNTKCKVKISRDAGLTWADWQPFTGTGATHVFSPVNMGNGTVLFGTGTTGEVWSTGDVSRTPPAGDGGSIVLWGYNRSGASKPAGTPVILGGIATTSPSQGADLSFYGSSNNGDLTTVGVLLDTTANAAIGRVLVLGKATLNVQSGAYVPGDLLRTSTDGLTAVVDNAVVAHKKLGKVLVGGSSVTTVTALIGPF